MADGWRDLAKDAMSALEDLAFADELNLSCQKGIVIRCACKECLIGRAIDTNGKLRAMLAAAPAAPAADWRAGGVT